MELLERGFNRASKFLLIVIRLMRIKWLGLVARIEEIRIEHFIVICLFLLFFGCFFVFCFLFCKTVGQFVTDHNSARFSRF
jgi:hypothetical protein